MFVLFLQFHVSQMNLAVGLVLDKCSLTPLSD